MLFVDAGTVHAIGPGVVLLETQQTSDVTYRLYDYGRPRELHLEKGLQVIKPKTAAGKVAPRVMDGFTRLIEQKYFVVDRFDVAPGKVTVTLDAAGCLVGLAGAGAVVRVDGSVELKIGQAVIVPEGGSVIVETGSGMTFMRCVAPSSRGR
jgi:mannose-6-phosphate isomerase